MQEIRIPMKVVFDSLGMFDPPTPEIRLSAEQSKTLTDAVNKITESLPDQMLTPDVLQDSLRRLYANEPVTPTDLMFALAQNPELRKKLEGRRLITAPNRRQGSPRMFNVASLFP